MKGHLRTFFKNKNQQKRRNDNRDTTNPPCKSNTHHIRLNKTDRQQKMRNMQSTSNIQLNINQVEPFTNYYINK